MAVTDLGEFENFDGASNAADTFASKSGEDVLWIADEQDLRNLQEGITTALKPINDAINKRNAELGIGPYFVIGGPNDIAHGC